MRDREISKVIQILNKEVQHWQMPVPGHSTRNPFTILMACLLSLRTQDNTTDEASSRLFQLAETPQDMRKLSAAAIQKAIYPVGFYKTKAENIKTISAIRSPQFAAYARSAAIASAWGSADRAHNRPGKAEIED
jgi:endonuclease-3